MEAQNMRALGVERKRGDAKYEGAVCGHEV